MRTITAALLAAQSAASYTPYFDLVFHNRDDTATLDYSLTLTATNRIMDIQHHELQYDDYAVIILRNNDRAIPDLKGWWVEIGYGANTTGFGGAGNEYEKTARLWVANQESVSAPGTVITELKLEGIWRRWARHQVITLGGAPYFEYAFNGLYNLFGTPTQGASATLAMILKWLIETNLAQNLRSYMAGTLTFPASQDDSILNTYSPYFAINQNSIEPAIEIIQRLLVLTNSYLRSRKSINFEIRYPQDTDAADITYYSDQAPWFKEYVESESVLVPNQVVFFGCSQAAYEDGSWSPYVWYPFDQVGANEELVRQIIAMPGVESLGELIIYAEAYLKRIKNRRVAGRMIAPHDCRLEIHDKIEILDRRGG